MYATDRRQTASLLNAPLQGHNNQWCLYKRNSKWNWNDMINWLILLKLKLKIMRELYWKNYGLTNSPIGFQLLLFDEISTFLPRDAVHKRGLCCGQVSVCPSVTFVHSIQTAENIVKPLNHHSSFLTPGADTQFQGNPFSRGANTRGGKILRFSTEIAVYLGNGTR